jgi:hypothetical protein
MVNVFVSPRDSSQVLSIIDLHLTLVLASPVARTFELVEE